MAARVEGFSLLQGSGWRILKPVTGWAFVATLLRVIRRRARQPSLPKMSERWLLSHQAAFHRDEY